MPSPRCRAGPPSRPRSALLIDLGELALLSAFFLLTPAVFAVGMYFLLWHSSRHILRLTASEPHQRALLDKGRTTVHHSHTPDITFESRTKAKGIWGMEDYIFDSETEELLIHGFGFYHETYEKRDGKWLFTSRQLKRTLVREKPESSKA